MHSHYYIIQSLTHLSDINFAVNFGENFMSITYSLHYSSLNSHSVHENDSFINESYLHSNKTSAKSFAQLKYSKNLNPKADFQLTRFNDFCIAYHRKTHEK